MCTEASPDGYTVKKSCTACKKTGKIKVADGRKIVCPYCDGTKKRTEHVPHPTHKMTKWQCEIRCPCDTPRFYSVRECKNCGKEELQHAAGHFLYGLDFPCKEGIIKEIRRK